jgi:hypothetical protein
LAAFSLHARSTFQGTSSMPDRSNRAKPPKAHRRRTPSHPLARQVEQKPISAPMQQARSRILDQLTDTIAACQELFEEHGEACSCESCCLVSNLIGSLKVFRMLLEIT